MNESEVPTPPPAAGGESSNRGVMIVLSYLWLLALIPLLVEKDDKEVQWHAKHGLVLTVAWVAVFIVLTILGMVLSAVTAGIAGCFMAIVQLLLMLGIVIVHILCIVKGLNGERFLLPVISDYADKF